MIDLPYTKTGDGIIIEVRVIPRSSKKEIIGIVDNVVKIKLTAPPVGGAANKQLIELLSEKYGISKSNIVILKGNSSKQKKVKIMGVKFDSEHDRIRRG